MLTIPQILSGSTVLLTGGSGFLGASILLRLVQSDLSLKRIYAIVRSDPGADPADRLSTELKPFLDRRGSSGEWLGSGIIRTVAGDCSVLGLGLNKEDSKIILQEAEIMIHSAANTAFGRPLSVLAINISMAHATATFTLLSKNIRTHIHLSTVMTGAHLPDNTVYEEQLLTNEVESCHENSYITSKSVAEGIVNSFAAVGSNKQFTIIRVSVVAPAYRFPIMGYGADSGSSPVVVACLTKPFDVLPEGIDPNFGRGKKLDCIPVDISANQIIALTASSHLMSKPCLLTERLPFSSSQSVNVFHSSVGMDGIVCIEWNDVQHKVMSPFMSIESIIKNYGHFFSRTLRISTDKARYVYGLPSKSGLKLQTSGLIPVDCTGFEVEFDNFESFGVKNYLRAIRDKLDNQ